MFDLEKTQVENLMTMALSPYLLFTGTAFFERKKKYSETTARHANYIHSLFLL
jgi:hypothetical protein